MKFGWLKQIMPRGLYGRAALILILPVVTIQLVVSVVFIQRHFERVTRQMTASMLREIALVVDRVEAAPSLAAVLATVAALTWANPHVWLDTVVLLGAVSAQFPGEGLAFGAGAATASVLFFFALAYGARLLAPLFARPAAWRLLDAGVALILASVAVRLALGAL